ncbi:MAG: hypothetical protein JKX94_09490 [Sneathiella sp.]|nr:hypothetical protein [Sneathiella sp.]
MIKKIALIGLSLFILTGCGTWSHTEAKKDGKAVLVATTGEETKNPDDIIISKEDITDKKYTVVAELDVVVNKTTIFHEDPTPELVDVKLKEAAAKLGADAVILVRYGSVGMSLVSWGSLGGKGRAIRFD